VVQYLIVGGPQPPHLVMPQGPQLWFTIWLAIPLAVVLGIAVRHIATGKGPLLLFCVLGGAIASAYEAIVNVLGTMIYAEDGIWTAYSTFDRKIPTLMAYAWFMGGQAYLCYRLLARGITRWGLFKLRAAFCLVDPVIETPGLLAGAYVYYGNQPLDFWGFPVWYAWANSLVPVVAGALIYKLRDHYGTGWRQLGVIPLVPMVNGIAYAAVRWPLWSVLNTSLGYPATYLAACLTLTLSCYVLWIVSTAVATDRKSHAPVEGTSVSAVA
jgi:hypothetical protein